MSASQQRLNRIREAIRSAVDPIYAHATAYLVKQFTPSSVSEYGIPTLQKRVGQHIWLTWPHEDSPLHVYLDSPRFQRRILLTSIVGDDFRAVEYLASGPIRTENTVWFFEEVRRRIELYTHHRIEYLASIYDRYIHWLEKNSVFDSIYTLLYLSGRYKPIQLRLNGYLFHTDTEETVIWYVRNVISKLHVVLYAGLEELYQSLQGKCLDVLDRTVPDQTIEFDRTYDTVRLSFKTVDRIAKDLVDVSIECTVGDHRFHVVIGRYKGDPLTPVESYTTSNAVLLSSLAEHNPSTVVKLYTWLNDLVSLYASAGVSSHNEQLGG